MTIIHSTVSRLIYILLYLIGSLPFRVTHWASTMIGNLWFAFDARHRNVAIGNLERAFGSEMSPETIREIARENFRQLARLLFEVGWSLRLKNKDIRKHIRVEGLENTRRAFSENKGVLFLTGHLGSWELLTLVPALIPYTIHDIYRPLDYKPLDRVFIDFRTRFGMKLISKEGAIKNILRALSRKEGVGIPLDQSVGAKDGVFTDFFGQPTCTSKGMALIAIKTGAPVIPVFMVREHGRFKTIFGPKIHCEKTGDTHLDLIEYTSAYNNVIEDFVRHYPSQWFWVHNRWKTKFNPNL